MPDTIYADPTAPDSTTYTKQCGSAPPSTQEISANNPDFAFNVFITAPTVKVYPILTSANIVFEIRSITGFTNSGSANISIEIDGVPVPGLTNVVLDASRRAYSASGGSDYVAVGARVTVNVLSVSTPIDLEMTIACAR